jgi:hypothetical protein
LSRSFRLAACVLISDMLHHTSDIVKKKMRSNERDRFNALAVKKGLLRALKCPRNDEGILLVAELLLKMVKNGLTRITGTCTFCTCPRNSHDAFVSGEIRVLTQDYVKYLLQK